MLRIYKSSQLEWTDEVFEVGKKPAAPAIKSEQDSVMDGCAASVVEAYEQAKQAAYNDAQHLVGEIVKKAEQDRERILAQAQKSAQAAAQKAYDEAYAAGFEKGAADACLQKQDEVRTLIGTLYEKIGEIEGQISGFVSGYEADLKWTALQIAEQILKTKLDEDETQLVPMIKAAVDSVKNAEWIKVELSQQSAQLIEQLKSEFAGRSNVEIVATHAQPGSCVVETPSGKIDASLATQLDNLRDYFSSQSVAL